MLISIFVFYFFLSHYYFFEPMHRNSTYINRINLFGDLLVLNTAFILSYLLKFDTMEGLATTSYLDLWLYVNVGWLLIALFFKPHELVRTSSFLHTLRKYVVYGLLHLSFIASLWVLFKAYHYSREQLLITYLLFFAFLFLWKLSLIYVLRAYRRMGFNYRKVIIVGYGGLGRSLKMYFDRHPEFGYQFLGYFDRKYVGKDSLGTVQDIAAYVVANEVDQIYCCMPNVRYSVVDKLVDFAEENLIKIKVIADIKGFSKKSFSLEHYDGIPILDISALPLDNLTNRVAKRTFDIVFSSLVIIGIFSWLFPLLAVAVKISSPGPVFFKQKRTGKDGKSFWCYKFRSMRLNLDADGMQATKNDRRITKVGAFMRKTSLDELPQFINVFLGNMSTVGPRPHMLLHTKEYSKLVEKFMARHFVKPGITGLAQAKGYRGETEQLGEMEGRVRLDRFYVENWSFYFDLRIIIQTIVSMVKGEEKAY